MTDAESKTAFNLLIEYIADRCIILSTEEQQLIKLFITEECNNV